jgi:hypothetical protein
MNPRPWFLITTAGLALALVGCGQKKAASGAGDGHAEHAEGESEESGGVTFKEGRGLQLSPEVIKALGVRTVEAEERSLAAELTVTAQVFATKPQVLASARVVAEHAESLHDAAFEGAELLRIDTAPAAATRLADAVFQLTDSGSRQIGDFVAIALKGKPATTLTVPRAAILDGATGTFVYVVNSGAYLRTPVKVGAQAGDLAEITDGIYAGDIVVAAPVDQLWLAELRLTKGGGHSH